MAGESTNSGRPLEKKLGIIDGMNVRLIHAPEYYFDLFEISPQNIQNSDDPKIAKDFIHLFTTSSKELIALLPQLKNEIRQEACIWVSWPKKTSKIKTEVNGNLIRDWAIRCGLVDVKVCSVDETWSALKLVIPLKNRK